MSKRRPSRGQRPNPARVTARRARRLASLGVPAGAALLGLGSGQAEAATFPVTNLNDSGAGSLRQALADANTNPGPDIVTFQSGLTGTITLTTGQLAITDSVDIQGPGAAVISVSGNNASRVFYLYNGSAVLDLTISGLTITGGSASIGGGVINFDEHLTLNGVTVTGNTATGDGGGIWADGFNMLLTISNSTISGNTSGDDGGGIYVEDTGGPLVIQNSTISGNQAADKGGGIYFYDPDADVTIVDSTISGNTAGTEGGGIYLYSPDSGSFTIRRTTISGNTASAGGGAFFYGPDHPMVLENVTIANNSATSGDGGGIYFYNAYDTLAIRNSTIASNTASSDGGGLFLGSGSLDLQNSIVADNTAAADNDLSGGGDFNTAFSLIESPGGANVNDLGGNVFNQDPQLSALAANGGPTQTKLFAPASPARNAGDPAFVPPPATDQRGNPRVVEGRIDMGALELQPGTLQFSAATYGVLENAGTATITVTRVGGTDGAASASYTTSDGTAGQPGDYQTAAGSVAFANADAVPKTFTVTIVDDTSVEGPETVNLALTGLSGTVLGTPSTAVLTIQDFEAGQLQFSAASFPGSEGTVVTVTVQRVNGTDGAVSVSFATSDGTANQPGDYTSASGSLSWASGDGAPRTFNVTLATDLLPEGTETVNLTLSLPQGGATLGAQAGATIPIQNATSEPIEIPLLDDWGRIALAGIIAAIGFALLGRRRIAGPLVLTLVLGAGAAMAETPRAARARAPESRSITVGTVETISTTGTEATLVLSRAPALRAAMTDVIVKDRRGRAGRAATPTLASLRPDQPVSVKVVRNSDGTVKKMVVKVFDSLARAQKDAAETKR